MVMRVTTMKGTTMKGTIHVCIVSFVTTMKGAIEGSIAGSIVMTMTLPTPRKLCRRVCRLSMGRKALAERAGGLGRTRSAEDREHSKPEAEKRYITAGCHLEKS
jgi:hypothetical protein